jgi:AMMECR1 domain-containing protein
MDAPLRIKCNAAARGEQFEAGDRTAMERLLHRGRLRGCLGWFAAMCGTHGTAGTA